MSGRSPRWISIAPMIGTLRVGSVVKLNLNSTPWDWLVVHQGLPSSIYDESCNGTWLLSRDIYEERIWNSTASDVLESSQIQSYLNGDFLSMFDSKTQSVIKQVKIPYRSGGGKGGTTMNGADGLSCKVFLLSAYEAGFTTSDDTYIPSDGAKLDYFASGTGQDALNRRLANLNGEAYGWWLRSPYTRYNKYPCYIADSGELKRVGATASLGVRPAIILPSALRIPTNLISAA